MSEPATADWILVLCFGACALKWRIALCESVFSAAATDMMLEWEGRVEWTGLSGERSQEVCEI